MIQLRFLGLTDADVPLDTNHVERALGVVPMGRKNWLFAWTEIGAEHIGMIQSLLVTCRLHDVNPYDYLVDVLQRVDRQFRHAGGGIDAASLERDVCAESSAFRCF